MSKPKTISICAKCSDMCSASLLDEAGDVLHDRDGYVPSFFPGKNYGDYVMLDIDLATGQITNWKAPSAADLKRFIDEG